MNCGPTLGAESIQGTKIDKLHINQAVELKTPDSQTRFQIRLNVIIQLCDVKVTIGYWPKKERNHENTSSRNGRQYSSFALDITI